MGLMSGTEFLRGAEQTEVGTDEEHTAAGDFSISVLCLALTMPTGIVPEHTVSKYRAELLKCMTWKLGGKLSNAQ